MKVFMMLMMLRSIVCWLSIFWIFVSPFWVCEAWFHSVHGMNMMIFKFENFERIFDEVNCMLIEDFLDFCKHKEIWFSYFYGVNMRVFMMLMMLNEVSCMLIEDFLNFCEPRGGQEFSVDSEDVWSLIFIVLWWE